jgi:hypothetical protein
MRCVGNWAGAAEAKARRKLKFKGEELLLRKEQYKKENYS